MNKQYLYLFFGIVVGLLIVGIAVVGTNENVLAVVDLGIILAISAVLILITKLEIINKSTVKVLAFAVGLVSAVAYILVDDNNIVSLGVENLLYLVAWTGIVTTVFLAQLRMWGNKKTLSRRV